MRAAAWCTAASPAASTEPSECMSSALAVPVGDQAAGARDHRRQGGEVVELEIVLDHQVDVARGQQAVGVAVAAPAEELHLRSAPRASSRRRRET